MKNFGLQLYSIRDHFTSEEDTRESFRRMREYGYTEAQTAGTYSYMDPAAFRALADEYGIRIVGTHYDLKLMKEDVAGTVAYHKALGTDAIGIGGMPGASHADLAAVESFIREYNTLAEIYATYGFHLTYHNHAYEFRKLEDGKTAFDHMIEKFDKSVTFVLDVYWAQVAGMDVRDLIERLSGRLEMLHLKDCEAAVEYKIADGSTEHEPRYVEVGRGNINFARIIPTAEKCGCRFFTVEDEYYSTGESYDSIRMSAEYIKEKLLEK